MISIFTDGGARGNPGPAAIGVYIVSDKGKINGFGEKIGVATNNVSEYKAVIAGLDFLIKNKGIAKNDLNVSFYLDSKLVCSQINGLFKIKEPKLRELLFIIREKEADLKINIRYFYIPREKNKEADRLVNQALDNKL